jgi:hypothetical protein
MNASIANEASHVLAVQLYQGLEWKAELDDFLKRNTATTRESPNHPVNSKIHRKLDVFE